MRIVSEKDKELLKTKIFFKRSHAQTKSFTISLALSSSTGAEAQRAPGTNEEDLIN